MSDHTLAAKTQYPSKFARVLDSNIHYLEAGMGDPILFLHGVPTSSYVWRNVMPHLASLGRCIAPDLIGFGKSDKPDIAYTIHDHIKYITAFIDALHLKKVTIVMHGWGSIIGSQYAMTHENNCRGLVFYESFIQSMSEENISLPFEEQLSSFEELETVYDPLTNGSRFIDLMLPQIVMRKLSELELENYRKPFVEAGAGKPLLQYINELPRGDGASEIDKMIASYTKKLEKSRLPKLLLYSIPGFITTVATVMWAKEHLPNLEVMDVGEELHLGQEAYPDLIGEAISAWLQNIEQHG
jgi:haloalkane dehalogenase